MPKFFVAPEQIDEKNEKIEIIGSDVNHIKNVLRNKVGDILEICNISNEQNYNCKIEEIQKENIKTKIVEKMDKIEETNVKVSIYQGIPKAEKMELIIQKAVELGAYEIIPVEMKRCVVKLKEKDVTKKIQRWQKISEVAAKQCGRNRIPKIHSIITANDMSNKISEYDAVLVAYEEEKVLTLKEELLRVKQWNKECLKIAIVIGPEGGLESKEVEKWERMGAKVITLGKRILRTETVALQMISIIMYELEK